MTRRCVIGGLGSVAGAATAGGGAPPIWAQSGTQSGTPTSAAVPAAGRLAGVTSWGYQLQKASLGELAASPYDLLVVDSTKNGDAERPLTRAEVKRLQTRPRSGRRIVLAYVSIGEAEDYRFYWNDEWLDVATPDEPVVPAVPAGKAPPPKGAKAAAPKGKQPQPAAAPEKPDRWLSAKAPPWLGDENEAWGGNFEVKYWDPAWQKLMFGDAGAYLERVVAQGFDGLYLDRVDAYYNHSDAHPTAADDMTDFVIRLATAARALKPDCIIVPQNAEELLLNGAYLDVIDGIAKEDLLYGSPTEGELNHDQQVANSLRWLSPAKEKGLGVLVVEYLARADLRAAARTAIRTLGFVPYFAPRSLDSLQLPETPVQVKAAQAAAARAAAAGDVTPAAAGQSQTPAAAVDTMPPKLQRR